MNGDILLGLFLRLLPTILIAALAFIAASDAKSREQWANLLYQIGSIKPAQRTDAKVQSGVRWPFLIVAVVFLIWPLRYYQHATKTIEVKENPFAKPTQSASPVFGNSVTDDAATGNATTENPADNSADNSGGQSPMFR